MNQFLDDNRIKAILMEENSSEEEIGSDMCKSCSG